MHQKRAPALNFKSPNLLLVLILFTYLLIGIATVKDFGESEDEEYAYKYATNSLAAYVGQGKKLLDEKGPSYVMIARIGSSLLSRINPQWLPKESWHLMHFISFLIGLVFLYIICLKINASRPAQPKTLNQWGALGAVLLFSTQPLIWGHAFINHKDLPFMAFFLGSIALGLVMVDSFAKVSLDRPTPSRPSLRLLILNEWVGMDKKRQGRFIWFCALVIGIGIALLVLRPLANELVRYSIPKMYSADPSSLLGGIFARFAEKHEYIPVDYYIQKGQVFYRQFISLYLLLTCGLIFLASVWAFLDTTRQFWREDVRPFGRSFLASFTNGRLIVAGVMLGFCSSIRTLGPAAGVLIGIYFLMKWGRKALPSLLAYLLLGFLVTYITWPGLWGSPIRNYLVSFSQASDFNWGGKVMFAGIDYLPVDLPRSYLPVLLSIQFTETALLIFFIGLLTAAIRVYRNRIDWNLFLLVGIWFLAPILAAVILHPTMYDNFRHFLFAVPPIFIIGSVGIQALTERIKNSALSIILLFVLVLPGVIGIIRLHPYEYVYYNSVVGGTSGAFRKYEMDYWATSYRAATDYLNQNAPQDSSVIVWGPYWLVKNYARPDLNVIDYRQSDEVRTTANYAVLSTRHDKDLTLFPKAKEVFSVSRQRALFSVVKQLNPAQGSQP